MKRQTKAEKQADARIDRAFNANCKNIQISIMDIPKVFKMGREAIAAGADDNMLAASVIEFVQTIRKN